MFSCVVEIGTQSGFHPNVHEMARGLRLNPKYCSQNNVIPIDKLFKPEFNVDWCRLFVVNASNFDLKFKDTYLQLK